MSILPIRFFFLWVLRLFLFLLTFDDDMGLAGFCLGIDKRGIDMGGGSLGVYCSAWGKGQKTELESKGTGFKPRSFLLAFLQTSRIFFLLICVRHRLSLLIFFLSQYFFWCYLLNRGSKFFDKMKFIFYKICRCY